VTASNDSSKIKIVRGGKQREVTAVKLRQESMPAVKQRAVREGK
jgi:hypothetical protein